MDISKLDEYQGLEAQMVREWMTRKGCYRQDGYWHWRHPRDKYRYTDGEYGGLLWDDTLFKLSVDFELASVQALLREINPRMREITDGAFRSHSFNGGWWIIEDTNREPTVRRLIIKWCSDDGQKRAIGWPCDEHGNKIRWPTDANGAML